MGTRETTLQPVKSVSYDWLLADMPPCQSLEFTKVLHMENKKANQGLFLQELCATAGITEKKMDYTRDKCISNHVLCAKPSSSPGKGKGDFKRCQKKDCFFFKLISICRGIHWLSVGSVNDPKLFWGKINVYNLLAQMLLWAIDHKPNEDSFTQHLSLRMVF